MYGFFPRPLTRVHACVLSRKSFVCLSILLLLIGKKGKEEKFFLRRMFLRVFLTLLLVPPSPAREVGVCEECLCSRENDLVRCDGRTLTLTTTSFPASSWSFVNTTGFTSRFLPRSLLRSVRNIDVRGSGVTCGDLVKMAGRSWKVQCMDDFSGSPTTTTPQPENYTAPASITTHKHFHWLKFKTFTPPPNTTTSQSPNSTDPQNSSLIPPPPPNSTSTSPFTLKGARIALTAPYICLIGSGIVVGLAGLGVCIFRKRRRVLKKRKLRREALTALHSSDTHQPTLNNPPLLLNNPGPSSSCQDSMELSLLRHSPTSSSGSSDSQETVFCLGSYANSGGEEENGVAPIM